MDPSQTSFYALADTAVRDCLRELDPAPATIFDEEARQAATCVVELLLIYRDRPVDAARAQAVATKLLRHFAETGLVTPSAMTRFAVRSSEPIAHALRDDEALLRDNLTIDDILRP